MIVQKGALLCTHSIYSTFETWRSAMLSTTTTNQLLDGRYRIICALGSGGMGQTYIAEDVRRPNNSKCVIKQLKPANHDPNFLITARRLFRNEAVILESLGKECDRIPKLLAYFEQNQEFYLVQEFVDGQPLTTEMSLGDRWSEAQVIQLLEEVLSILEVIHRQGVIHRDIKPDNLIRRTDGKLVLIDFGAVKQLRQDHFTSPGMISMTVGLGTPGYMPNEQSNGKPRPSSDLYALGMVAIQALTGMLPSQLRDDDEGEIVWREQANVSEELGNFLTKMVRYHFKHRYETAFDALQALHKLQSTSPQSASHSVNTPTEPEEFIRRSTQKVNTTEAVPPQPGDSSQNSQQRTVSTPTEPVAPPQPKRAAASTSPKKKSIWISAGLAVTTIGLLASAGYMYVRSQQTQALERIQQSYAVDRFDECMTQATVFPGYHSKLYMEAQTIAATCQTAKAQQLALEEIDELKDRKEYKEAIHQAEKFSDPNSKFYKEARKLLGESQLALGQQLANQNKFRDAITQVKNVAPDASTYPEAQRLMGRWSDKILAVAEEHYQKAGTDEAFQAALKFAEAVPKDSSASEKARNSITQWKQNWVKNKDDHWRAKVALDEKRWQDALDAANQLINSSTATTFWRGAAQAIVQQANKALLPILDQESVLDASSPRRSQDNTAYQDFTFQGNADQVVTIVMESSDFDSRLFLVSPSDRLLKESDDAFAGGYDAAIRHFRLPETGTYRIRANAYSSQGKGRFKLTVVNAK
jgi:serine/threonine protein kinase, bacterial